MYWGQFYLYWTPLTGPMSNSNSVWSSKKQISRHNLSKHLCRNLYYFPKLHRDRIHAWILLGLGIYLFFLGVRMKRFLWIWKKLCRLFFFCWIWQRPFPCNILDQGEVICCFAVVVFPHPFGPMISTAPKMCPICLLKGYPQFLLYIVILTSVSNICGISFPTFVVFYFHYLWYFTSNFCGKFIKGIQTKYQMRQIKSLIPGIKPISNLNGAGYRNWTCTGVLTTS